MNRNRQSLLTLIFGVLGSSRAAQAQTAPAEACAVFGWDQHGIRLVRRSLDLQFEKVGTA